MLWFAYLDELCVRSFCVFFVVIVVVVVVVGGVSVVVIVRSPTVSRVSAFQITVLNVIIHAFNGVELKMKCIAICKHYHITDVPNLKIMW